MKFTIHQSSLQGPRPYNQDRLAYSYSKDSLLLVIADGMGGYRHGEVAAQLAVKMLTDAFQRSASPVIANPARFLNEEILSVHDAIENFTQANHLSDSPRTTIATVLLQDNTLYCAHVGDSRIYHLRNGNLIYRTMDHSVVQALYRRGQIGKEEMSNHPDRHKIYNCLGGGRDPEIELAEPTPIYEGDKLLLCTDGLWSAIRDEEITKIFNSGSISNAITKLLNIAETLSDENGDNMSAIGLQWGGQMPSYLAVSTMTMPWGETTTIINPAYQKAHGESGASAPADLSDEEIEMAISEIQAAISKINT